MPTLGIWSSGDTYLWVQALADSVHAQGGALDVLINNAGIGYLGRFLDSDLLLTGPYARTAYHAWRLSLSLVRRLMTSSTRKVGYL